MSEVDLLEHFLATHTTDSIQLERSQTGVPEKPERVQVKLLKGTYGFTAAARTQSDATKLVAKQVIGFLRMSNTQFKQ